MTENRISTLAEVGALTGVILLAFAVALIPGDWTAGPLDGVVIFVPLAIALAFPLMRAYGSARLPWYSVELPGLAFILVALVSTMISSPTTDSVLTVARYASYLVLLVAVGTVALRAEARRIVLWAVAIAGSVTFAHAASQWIAPGEVRAIGILGLDPSVATRVFATFLNPNFYGEYLVLLFGVLLALVLTEKHFGRLVAAVLLAGCMFVLLLTYTRGSWLALAVGLVIALAMVNVRLVVPIAVLGAIGAAVVPGVAARLMSAFSLSGSASFRLNLWRIAGEAIVERPFFGMGAGRFTDAFRAVVESRPDLAMGYLEYGAHNSLLTITAEMGIFAGVVFVWLVFSIIRTGLVIGSRDGLDHDDRLANAALTAGLIAFALNALTSNAFQHPQAAATFFLVAGVQAGMGMRYLACPETAAPHMIERPRGVAGESWFVRGVLSAVAFVRLSWRDSGVRHILVTPHRTAGRLIGESRVARFVFGRATAPEDRAACASG